MHPAWHWSTGLGSEQNVDSICSLLQSAIKTAGVIGGRGVEELDRPDGGRVGVDGEPGEEVGGGVDHDGAVPREAEQGHLQAVRGPFQSGRRGVESERGLADASTVGDVNGADFVGRQSAIEDAKFINEAVEKAATAAPAA